MISRARRLDGGMSIFSIFIIASNARLATRRVGGRSGQGPPLATIGPRPSVNASAVIKEYSKCPLRERDMGALVNALAARSGQLDYRDMKRAEAMLFLGKRKLSARGVS